MKAPPKELDRRFRRIGRIKRAWGTDHIPTRRAMDDMVGVLYSMGKFDILRGLKGPRPTYTPLEVYDAYRLGELERLPTAATLAPLKETMTAWIERKECSEAHRRSLSQSLRHLHAGSSPVAELPKLLASLREKQQGKHPRSFNLARAAAQAFAKTTAGRNSKLWSDISQVEVLRVTPQRKGHPLSPSELMTITDKMADNYALMAQAMAYTGMGPTEYWGKWETGGDRILIHGTKRSGRNRFVPWIWPIIAPRSEYAAFRRALRDASDPEVKPYDLRRTYATWLEAAGIPRTRRRLYMGHGARDITDLYERHEVERFLEEDAYKLRAYVFGATENTGLRLEKA